MRTVIDDELAASEPWFQLRAKSTMRGEMSTP